MLSLMPTGDLRPIQLQLQPISFLPNEILIHIFQLGLDGVPYSARAHPLPVVVAGVCRSWRAVTLCTPDLWTRVFVTSVTPINHLRTYLERSENFDIDVNFCYWRMSMHVDEDGLDDPLPELICALHRHAHRLRSLSLWDVSDKIVCAIIKSLLYLQIPRLTRVSIKANHTAYTHYYHLRDLYLLPFVVGGAPSLTHLEIDHFPIETLGRRSHWSFEVQQLTSLTLRTQECPTLGFSLPPYLIEFSALCALLQSTPNLTMLALYGPIIQPDEDNSMRPPIVTLPLLETLIIHRRDPGIRYHLQLLNTLAVPNLRHIEIPWHDDLTVELPYADHAAEYLFDEEGQPRFPCVKELHLYDSAVKWKLPTRSFIKAFPNVEEVTLGGTDVAKFAATLRGFVSPYPVHHVRGSDHLDLEGMLTDGAWRTVRKVVLKEPEVTRWKGWVRGFYKWLAAGGHAGQVYVELQDCALHSQLDGRGMRAFRRGLDRLRRRAQVTVM